MTSLPFALRAWQLWFCVLLFLVLLAFRVGCGERSEVSAATNLRYQLRGARLNIGLNFAGETQKDFRQFDTFRIDEFVAMSVKVLMQLFHRVAVEKFVVDFAFQHCLLHDLGSHRLARRYRIDSLGT